MDLCHVKMLNVNLNQMDVNFGHLVITFIFLWMKFEHGYSFVLSYLTFKKYLVTFES